MGPFGVQSSVGLLWVLLRLPIHCAYRTNAEAAKPHRGVHAVTPERILGNNVLQ